MRPSFPTLPQMRAAVRRTARGSAEVLLRAGLKRACMVLTLAWLGSGLAFAHSSAEDAQAESCRLGTYAYAEFDRAAALQPIALWLREHTGCGWTIEILDSPGALADAMAAGELDWAVPNLVGHLRAVQKSPSLHAGPRIAVPPADAARYRSLLLARAGTVPGLDALRADAPRLRLGLTFADSASGGLVPAALLAAAGLDVQSDFAELRYTGRHDASLRLLLAGELDLIGLPADLLPAAQRAQVLVLAESAPIPVGAMLCGGRIAARCAALAAALAEAPEAAALARALADAWPEFGAAEGFETAPEAEYAELLRALATEDTP